MCKRLTGYIKYTLMALFIWVIGCALADYVFHLGDNSWRMLWGAVLLMIIQSVEILMGWTEDPHQGRGGGG